MIQNNTFNFADKKCQVKNNQLDCLNYIILFVDSFVQQMNTSVSFYVQLQKETALLTKAIRRSPKYIKFTFKTFENNYKTCSVLSINSFCITLPRATK